MRKFALIPANECGRRNLPRIHRNLLVPWRWWRSAQLLYRFDGKLADSWSRRHLPRSLTILVAQWQIAAVAEICSGPIQIWWPNGKRPLLSRSAYVLYKFGGKLADGCGRGNLPTSYTNLVANWQMAAIEEIRPTDRRGVKSLLRTCGKVADFCIQK